MTLQDKQFKIKYLTWEIAGMKLWLDRIPNEHLVIASNISNLEERIRDYRKADQELFDRLDATKQSLANAEKLLLELKNDRGTGTVTVTSI